MEEETVFDKYNKILEKVSNIIKNTLMVNLYTTNKYLKISAKESSRFFYAPEIWTDSIHKEYQSYVPTIIHRTTRTYFISIRY